MPIILRLLKAYIKNKLFILFYFVIIPEKNKNNKFQSVGTIRYQNSISFLKN